MALIGQFSVNHGTFLRFRFFCIQISHTFCEQYMYVLVDQKNRLNETEKELSQ